MKVVQPLKSREEIEAMRRSLRGRDLLLFVIGINTALRISDILPLRVKDVSGDYIELVEKKTTKTKCFRINQSIKDAAATLVPTDAKPDDYLFPSRKGDSHIGRVQAYRILNAAGRRAGIEHSFGTHSLRKTFARMAYESGVELPLLMNVLNHSSERETLRYIGIVADDIDQVYIDLCL